MQYAAAHHHKELLKRPQGIAQGLRLAWLQWFFIALSVAVIGRLFFLQVLDGTSFRLLATNQHEFQKILVPERGKILVRDRADGSLHPLATNRDSWTLYSEPRNIQDAGATARALAGFVPQTEAELVSAWTTKADDPYEPIAKGLDTRMANDILSKNLRGIGLMKGWSRFYPEEGIGGHLIGFVRMDDSGLGVGTYGIEGSFDSILAGKPGYVSAQKDADGRRLMLNGGKVRQAVNGADVILTIDRTIQFEVCRQLADAVKRYEAAGGSVVIMNPNTGAIIAMCGAPDFDPANYGSVKDMAAFNNPVTFSSYEPGSVFKAITMAIGIEQGKVNPKTTYEDLGVEKIDDFEIKNADELAHGTRTMTQVLEQSLNTGTIFVERQLGREAFRKGVEAFGFGKKTGIELSPESAGNIKSLSKPADVYGATASFGQGITVTPIQLASAFSAIANGGSLLKPYIVDEVIYPDGRHVKTKPIATAHPISSRTSQLMRGMLVSVVERGHAKKASVPGYFMAGKTGTAQVASSHGGGYLEGVTMTTFCGFAPAENPAFVMIVRIDRPKAGTWAEQNVAPLFKSIATFLLSYLEVPMERDVSAPTESESVPDLPPDITNAPDIVSVDSQASEEPQNGVNNGGSGTASSTATSTPTDANGN